MENRLNMHAFFTSKPPSKSKKTNDCCEKHEQLKKQFIINAAVLLGAYF